MEYEKITYDNREYGIIRINNIPIVLDWEDFRVIYCLDKQWQINDNNDVVTYYEEQNMNSVIYLHDIVMTLKSNFMNVSHDDQNKHKNVMHINKLNNDNRRCNLTYKDNTQNNTQNNIQGIKNLPPELVISDDESFYLSKYVSYIKPYGTHCDRFVVNIGNSIWKTTSSCKVSLRYKFEEAKKYLREVRSYHPELFEDYLLTDSFHKICNMKTIDINKLCKELDQKIDDLSSIEKKLLKNNKLYGVKRKKTLVSKLPKNCGISDCDLPKYCYYCPESSKRGDHFIIDGHPKLNKKYQTSTSKNISIQDKYKQLIEYLNQVQIQI